MVVWSAVAALAQTVTVCPSPSPLEPGYDNQCDLEACSFCTLAAATDGGQPNIELLPGVHHASRTAMIWVAGTQITGVDASLVALQGDEPLISVMEYAAGSRFVDLAMVSGGPTDGPLLKISADDTEVVRPMTTGLRSTSNVGGGAIRVFGALGVRIEDPVLVGTDSTGIGQGGVLRIERSTVDLSGGEISGSYGYWAAVYVEDSTLTMSGTELFGNSSEDWLGSQISSSASDLTLDEVTIDAPSSPWGTVVGASGPGTLAMIGGSVSSRGQGYGLGLVATEGLEWLTIHGTAFEGHTQTAVSAIHVGAVELTDTIFRGSTHTMSNGAFTAVGVPVVDVVGSWFCDQVAPVGAALNLAQSCEVGCSVRDSVFVGGLATDTGGAIRVDEGILDVVQSTIVGNSGFVDGGAIDARGAILDLRHSLVVDTTTNGGAIAGRLGVFEYNGFGRNGETDTNVDFPEDAPNLQDADPVFIAGPDPCGGDLALADDPANSWLIENRVGVYTGCWDDRDGDGFGGAFVADGPMVCSGGFASMAGDCDDDAASVFPGAPDDWYDDVDADCAGDDDQDQDGDGIGRDVDCDDLDPALGECSVGVGGGCAVAPTGGVLGWLLSAAFARRRRR